MLFAGRHPLSSRLTTAHVESHPSGGVALTNRSGPMHTPVEAPAEPRHTTAPDPPRRCPKTWGGLGPAPRRVTRKHRGPHAHSYGSVCARVSWHRALAPPQGQSPPAWQDRWWPSPPPQGYNSLMAVVCLEFLQKPRPEGEPCATSDSFPLKHAMAKARSCEEGESYRLLVCAWDWITLPWACPPKWIGPQLWLPLLAHRTVRAVPTTSRTGVTQHRSCGHHPGSRAGHPMSGSQLSCPPSPWRISPVFGPGM